MSRLVFACGTPHGGALESTLALARLEAAAGREVIVVVATDDPYGRLPTLTGFLVRVRTRSPRLGAVLWWLHDVVSGRGAAVAEHGVSVHRVSDVPAAVRRLLRRGDVVVMNSMRLLDLRRTSRFAATASANGDGARRRAMQSRSVVLYVAVMACLGMGRYVGGRRVFRGRLE